MTEPTTAAGRALLDLDNVKELSRGDLTDAIAAIEAEAFMRGWDAQETRVKHIQAAERKRLAAVIRENEDEWDTTYSAVKGINLDEVLSLLEEE